MICQIGCQYVIVRIDAIGPHLYSGQLCQINSLTATWRRRASPMRFGSRYSDSLLPLVLVPFFTPTDGIAIAAFRGTQSVDDWLHNLDFILAPYQPVPSSAAKHVI
jgi:hypothetical protein